MTIAFKIPTGVANSIYSLLLEWAGANWAGANWAGRYDFVKALESGCESYVFDGAFKLTFYNSTTWYVICEDELIHHQYRSMLDNINQRLIRLKAAQEPVGAIANGLYERYSQLYPSRKLQCKPSNVNHLFFHVLFLSTYDIEYISIMVDHHIKVQWRHLESEFRWQSVGSVEFDDPQMFEQLDALVNTALGLFLKSQLAHERLVNYEDES